MAIYRTLGPITYVDDGVVKTIDRAGKRVDLSPAQASLLDGLIAIDHSPPEDLPRAAVLYYDSVPFFPDMGYEHFIYVAYDTGKFYRWNLDTKEYVSMVIGGGGMVNSVNGHTTEDVVLDADDILDGSTNHKFATAAQLAKIDSYGQPNGLATLDSNGDVPAAQLPASTSGLAVLAGTPTSSRITLNVPTAQRARYGARTVFDGDSITLGAWSFSTWNMGRGGWCVECARLSGGRIDIVNNAAVAGTGIDTRLANFATKVAAFSPETVILSNGTNDVASMSLSDYLTKLTTYYDSVCGIGAQLILGGIYPKNVNQSTIATWNAALVEWAKPRGVLVIPFWELANPATGEWPTGWTSDGVHPLRESPAFAALGSLAWDTISRAMTEPVAPTARYAGEGLATNFFTDLTATISGVATITAISSTTGTLPAGTYTYRVVPRNYWGKNTNYADSSITLGGTGGVTITSGASGTYTRRAVYRKGPGESTFKYIGQITAVGSQTFTDNGITAGYDWVDGDSSRVPNGLLNGATQDLRTLQYGPPIRPGGFGDDVRGNILRLARQEASGNARVDRFLITGLTAGNTITVTFKCRASASVTATERVQLYFRDPTDATTIDTVPLVYYRLPNKWGLVFARAVVPPGSDRVRLSFEGDATSPWLDIAELRVA